MSKKDETIVTWTPPTEKEQFDSFCYEMYLKMKDEHVAWEGKLPNTSSKDYIKKNKTMLEKEFKRLRKKGNL